MADNARDQDFNLDTEAADVDRSDPLMELAQLMSGDAPSPARVEPAPAAPPAVDQTPATPDDLEAQLMAELGMGGETAPVETPIVAEPVEVEPTIAQAPVVEPVVEPIAETPAPVVAAPSIEDELAALLDAEPAAPVAAHVVAPEPELPIAEPDVETRVEDSLAADDGAVESRMIDDRSAAQNVSPYDFSDDARGGDDRAAAAEPEEIVDAFDTDLDAYMAVDFDEMDDVVQAEAPALDSAEELEAAPAPFSVNEEAPVEAIGSDAVSEAFMSEPEPEPAFTVEAAAPEIEPVAEVEAVADDASEDFIFDSFDDELNDEFDALFDNELSGAVDAETEAPTDEMTEAFDASELGLPEQTPPEPEIVEAEQEPASMADYAAPAAAIAAGAGILSAARNSGDDLLDHIGVSDASAASPLDELDAIMNEPAPQKPARPDIQTTDIDVFDDDAFADFEVPDLPTEAVASAPPISAAAQHADDFDFDLDIESELNAAEPAPSATTAADFDEDFATDDFEAVMARDMEYASHARAAPVVEDEDLFGDLDLEEAVEPAAPPPKKRGFFVAGITIAVALIGAVGVFALTGGTTDTSNGPVTVEADPTPIKVEPEEPGGSDVPNQDRALFNAENETAAANQPALVTTSEEPVDIANAPGAALPSAVANKDDDRLLPDADSAETGAEPVTSVNARRVRTLVVRPDGTLVEQPVEAPAVEVPEVVAQSPAAATQAVEQAVEDAASAVTDAVTENTGVAFNPPAAAPAPAPAAPAAEVPVRTVETQTITPPIIADRPNEQPVNIVNPQPQQNTQVAAAPQPAAPAPAPVASSTNAPFAVQIASVPSREGAQQSAVNLQQRFGNILGGRGVSIQEAQIEGRGTFYRVRVGAQSRDDANNLCAQYKRAGGSCFVTR